jgi:hypothetical protein
MKALAIAAGIVFGTLVLGTAWLAFFLGSDEAEPVAIIQIEPAPEPTEFSPAETAPAPESTEVPASPQPEGAEQAPGGVGLPPGIVVLAPALAPPPRM